MCFLIVILGTACLLKLTPAKVQVHSTSLSCLQETSLPYVRAPRTGTSCQQTCRQTFLRSRKCSREALLETIRWP